MWIEDLSIDITYDLSKFSLDSTYKWFLLSGVLHSFFVTNRNESFSSFQQVWNNAIGNIDNQKR